MKNNKLLELKEFVLTHNISEIAESLELFGGADISIVFKLPEIKTEFYNKPIYVVTNYARELSWLIYKLKDIYKEDLDYLIKYNFYGRLAERANLSLKKGNIKPIELLNDVIDEAMTISNE